MQLPSLFEQTLAGKEVIVTEAGRPLVRMLRIDPSRSVLRSAQRTITFYSGWDDPLPTKEVEDTFGE